jgi:hypothetical protein
VVAFKVLLGNSEIDFSRFHLLNSLRRKQFHLIPLKPEEGRVGEERVWGGSGRQ